MLITPTAPKGQPGLGGGAADRGQPEQGAEQGRQQDMVDLGQDGVKHDPALQGYRLNERFIQ